jgi:hypothetical protein
MTDLDQGAVLDALDAVYRNVTAVAGGLGEADLMRPTRCLPASAFGGGRPRRGDTVTTTATSYSAS